MKSPACGLPAKSRVVYNPNFVMSLPINRFLVVFYLLVGVNVTMAASTQAHGGALTVESEVGDGATFIVALPEN